MTKRDMVAGLAALLLIAQAGSALAAGAIAVDDEEGLKASAVGYGVGAGNTREEAAQAAMAQCKKAGNDGCKVVVRYDKCGAYAASKSHSGIGWGTSEDAAKTKALDDCGDKCKIVVSDCDED